jgi:hypothetical protein
VPGSGGTRRDAAPHQVERNGAHRHVLGLEADPINSPVYEVACATGAWGKRVGFCLGGAGRHAGSMMSKAPGPPGPPLLRRSTKSTSTTSPAAAVGPLPPSASTCTLTPLGVLKNLRAEGGRGPNAGQVGGEGGGQRRQISCEATSPHGNPNASNFFIVTCCLAAPEPLRGQRGDAWPRSGRLATAPARAKYRSPEAAVRNLRINNINVRSTTKTTS